MHTMSTWFWHKTGYDNSPKDNGATYAKCEPRWPTQDYARDSAFHEGAIDVRSTQLCDLLA
jgi:hypothetical protein